MTLASICPPISCVGDLLCDLLLVLARSRQGPGNASLSHVVEKGAAHRGVILALGIAGAIAYSAVWIWVLLAANNARLAAAHWNQAMDLEQALAGEAMAGHGPGVCHSDLPYGQGGPS